MNKKKTFGFLGILAVAAMATVNVNVNSQNGLSDMYLANTEALADESVSSKGCCNQGGYCIILVNGTIVYEASGQCPCSSG